MDRDEHHFSQMPPKESADQGDVPDAAKSATGGPKGVLFDVDGTLVDSWRVGFEATLEVNSLELVWS